MDARRRDCDDAPAIVPLHGVGHGAEAKLPGDGSAPCLPSQSRKVYRITLKYPEARPSPGVPPRIAQVGPQEPPAPSLRCARRALRFGGGSLLWTVMSVFKASGRNVPPGYFRFRLPALMQACAVEGGH